MICIIFKSAGIHVIGLTLFHLTIVCKDGATEPLHLFKQQVVYNADSSEAGTVPVSNQKVL